MWHDPFHHVRAKKVVPLAATEPRGPTPSDFSLFSTKLERGRNCLHRAQRSFPAKTFTLRSRMSGPCVESLPLACFCPKCAEKLTIEPGIAPKRGRKPEPATVRYKPQNRRHEDEPEKHD
jgi:hypothetical protein